MITFKTFLEQEQPKTLSEFAEYIELHCRDFLEKSHRKNFLVRGLDNSGKREFFVELDDKVHMPIFMKTTHAERRPRDSSLEKHKMVDSYFEKRFNFKARSNNVVFAFSYSDEAKDEIAESEYGAPWIIFPIGPIKYVWSEDVVDLWPHIDTPLVDSFTEEQWFEHLDRMQYRDQDLDKAMFMKREIMIQCEKYLVVNEKMAYTLGKLLQIEALT